MFHSVVTKPTHLYIPIFLFTQFYGMRWSITYKLSTIILYDIIPYKYLLYKKQKLVHIPIPWVPTNYSLTTNKQ